MTTTNQLKPGNYMKVSAVLNFIENHFKFSLQTLYYPGLDVVQKVCPIHKGEFDVYYSTTDLKNVIVPNIFREMECEVNTHMVLTEEELSKPNI